MSSKRFSFLPYYIHKHMHNIHLFICTCVCAFLCKILIILTSQLLVELICWMGFFFGFCIVLYTVLIIMVIKCFYNLYRYFVLCLVIFGGFWVTLVAYFSLYCFYTVHCFLEWMEKKDNKLQKEKIAWKGNHMFKLPFFLFSLIDFSVSFRCYYFKWQSELK